MASLAESSIASVPLSRLAQLHDNLLQDQIAVNALQPEAGSKTHLSGVPTATTKDGDLIIAESANAYNTPRSSPRGPPRLSASKSAPASQMEAMLHPSPSQEAFTALTRASSFHGYPVGDTQPMESQVYRDFTESAIGATLTTPKKTILKVQISPDGKATYDTVATETTPRTCVEGDTGFIDLENAWQPSSPAAQSRSSNLDELLENPQTQMEMEYGFVKAPMPQTPSVAGNKHSRNGDILSSPTTTKKTPGLTQLFGGHQKAPMLTATQLFNQTQAPSSPMPDGPRSDPVVTRPSPSMHEQYSVSSPTMIMSSPVAAMHSRGAMPGEPRVNYTSMRESQERRAAKLREELGLPERYHEDILEEADEETDMELIRYEHRKMQRVMSDQALHEWSRVRAPSRPGSRPSSRPTSSSKRPTTINLVTPAINKVSEVDFEVSDDGSPSAEDVVGQDEPPEDVQPSDDEYDELAQVVLRSQGGNEQDSEDEVDFAGGRDEEDEHIDVREDMIPHDDPEQEHEPTHRTQDHGLLTDTQHSAVADSQPVHHGEMPPPMPQQTVEPSSTLGCVPASQYTETTSQDQIHISLGAKTHPSRTSSSSSNHMEGGGLLSSPPLRPVSAGMPKKGMNSSSPGLLVGVESIEGTTATAKNEIPESDLPGSEDVEQHPSSPSAIPDQARHESNSMMPFSTARTHVSASGPSPGKSGQIAALLQPFASQHVTIASQSPRTAAGVRHFADIAAATSPPVGSAETDLDIDAIMTDVVTADDQDFMKAVSSPLQETARKRRRLSPVELTSTSSPSKANKSDVVQHITANRVLTSEQYVDCEKATGELQAVTTALHDSPSKGNELRPVTPSRDEQPEATPESVKRRETAGARAASQLLSSRGAIPVKTLEPKTGNAKRGGAQVRTAATVAVTTKHPKTKVIIKAPPKPKSRTPVETSVTSNSRETSKEQPTKGGQGPHDGIGSRTDDASTNDNGTLREQSAPPAIRAPNRVFALFRGSFNNFYPATWIGSSPDGSSFRIKFDDTTVTSIDRQHVRRFELRIGDAIKVDVDGMRNKTWLVHGFGDIAQDGRDQDTRTDIYGRLTVKVRSKATSSNAATKRSAIHGDGDVVDVAMTAVYLTPTMWTHFADRTFDPYGASKTTIIRAVTPSTGGQTPELEVSASRSGRTIVPTAKAKGTRASNLREESVASVDFPSPTGLFSGMAFAISYGNNENQKAEIARLILRNGGLIFEDGFNGLFNLPNLDESAPTSPTKKLAAKTDAPEADGTGLRLKTEYEGLGFVALIADRYSRRAKYVQALALGFPTLSGRWIMDSLDPSKNPVTGSDASPLPWAKYLLAAGESAYLDGATRSRTIKFYDAVTAKLSGVIENRDMLLNGDGILVVAPKKGKSTWERRKAFAFLTLALGAGYVRRVSDLNEAKASVSDDSEKWKWVYVDGSVAEASAMMFGKSNDGGKKRKRGDEVAKVDAKAMSAGNGKVRIVNDEFVIQSLILGSLVD